MADLKVTVDYSQLTGLIKTADQTKRTLSLMGQSLAQSGDMSAYMRGINQVVEAQKKLPAAARMSRSEIMKLGQEMKQQAQFATALGKATQQAAVQIQGVGKRANRAGVVFQQAGYQLGDFIVQAQSGTNVMVALGQQMTQMVGVGAMLSRSTKWIVAFSALGIVVPLLTAVGAAIMRSKDASKAAEPKLKSVKDLLGEMGEEAKDASDKLRLLHSSFEDIIQLETTDKIRELRDEIAGLQTTANDVITNFIKNMGGGGSQLTLGLESVQDPKVQAIIDAYRESLDLKIKELETKLKTIEANKRLLQHEEDYRDMLAEIRADQEKAKASHKERVDALRIENDLLSIRREYGEDSVAESDYLYSLEKEKLNALREAGLLTQEQFDLEVSLLGEQIKLNAALAESQERSEAFADALERAAAAAALMATLQPRRTYGGRGGGAEYYGTPDYTKALGYKTIDEIIAELTNTGGSGGDKETAEERLDALLRTAESERDLVGVEEERATQLRRTFDLTEQISQMEGGLTEERMKSIQTIVDLEAKTRLLQEAEEKREAQIDEIVGHIRSAFDSLIDGTETVEEAFRKMMYNIAKSIWEQQVMDPLANAATKWITNTFFSAKGSAWNNGVQMFANGGVVNSATPFRHAGGMGIMGEAGAEAIMPLKRGPDGKLGVAGGGNVTIHQNFNFAANGDESVKRIIAQEAPKIASMTQGQIMDARRRGGAMRNTFG